MNMAVKRRIVALDFFCGAGGLTRGLLDAGIQVLAGVDNDARLQKTYEINNSPSIFHCEDIRSVDIQSLRGDVGVEENDVVIYAACSPCQPFSTLNRSKAVDERRVLLLEFAELVRKSPPDFIIVENVPGLHNAGGKEIQDKFASILDECNFKFRYSECLDAKDYSVPQVRKRFVMLASRHGVVEAPIRQTKFPTVAEAIGHFPAITDGQAHPDFHNHEARKMLPHHKKLVAAVPINGGSRKDVSDSSLLLPCHRRNPNAHKDVFGRMSWEAASPTLTARCSDVYCGRFVHPEQDRGISLREAAALQTFRDDYVFDGTFFHIAQQIGNAVPVEFAKHLGNAVVLSAHNLKLV